MRTVVPGRELSSLKRRITTIGTITIGTQRRALVTAIGTITMGTQRGFVSNVGTTTVRTPTTMGTQRLVRRLKPYITLEWNVSIKIKRVKWF